MQSRLQELLRELEVVDQVFTHVGPCALYVDQLISCTLLSRTSRGVTVLELIDEKIREVLSIVSGSSTSISRTAHVYIVCEENYPETAYIPVKCCVCDRLVRVTKITLLARILATRYLDYAKIEFVCRDCVQRALGAQTVEHVVRNSAQRDATGYLLEVTHLLLVMALRRGLELVRLPEKCREYVEMIERAEQILAGMLYVKPRDDEAPTC